MKRGRVHVARGRALALAALILVGVGLLGGALAGAMLSARASGPSGPSSPATGCPGHAASLSGVPGCAPMPMVTPAPRTWPAFYHRVGAFYIGFDDDVQEIAAAARLGLSLDKTYYHPADSAFVAALQAHHMTYLDDYPWQEIQHYLALSCPSMPTNPSCTMTPANEAQLERAVKAHLALVKNDPTIAGFYVLDDYPGRIVPTLLAIHALVAQANKDSIVKRPTVCAFAAGLDYKKSPLDQAFTPNHQTFDLAITNYSPRACDIFALYPYGSNAYDDPSSVDWSMSAELPYMLGQFKRRGWNPRTQPFIGIPQAFGSMWDPAEKVQWQYLTPRAGDLSAQIAAFCRAGAASIMPFTWHYEGGDPASSMHQLYDTPALRRGLVDGIKRCRADWSR